MTVNTNTRMRLDHFHDFYYLQAVKAAISSEISNNPEAAFSRSVEKLQDDLQELWDETVPNMAIRTFVYLYAACIGEARHSSKDVAKYLFLKQANRVNRNQLFETSTNYRPTKDNIQALVDIFSQEWRSGFGGTAWKQIAEALKEYFTTPPATWIDHVVDLEHNNGTAFNKNDAKRTIMFEARYGNGKFKNFLDYKFRYDILKHKFEIKDGCRCRVCAKHGTTLMVTSRVYKILQRYCVIFRKTPPFWVKAGLETLDEYNVEWGNEKLTLEKKWAEWVYVGRNNRPTVNYLEDKAFGSVYIHNSTAKQLKKNYRRGMSYITKYHLKDIDAQRFSQAAKDWLEHALKHCKAEKAKVTYQAIPAKVRSGDDSLKFRFEIPYQKGIGTETKYGFSLVHKINPGIHTYGKYVRGHIYLGTCVCGLFSVNNAPETFAIKNKQLEAILE